MTTIGVIRPGSTFEGMIERHGDYDAWFARALEPTCVDVMVHDAVRHAPPAPDSTDGWIVTGARASVVDPEPWAERLLEWLRGVVEAEEVPLLGVCYGHQALCAAMGGRVERHAEGWEIGTTEVALTEAGRADPLFAGFPERFLVQTTHEDHAVEAPPGAAVLATNPHTPLQAVAIGRARGVQFHPEVTEEISRDFVERRRHLVTVPATVVAAPLAGAVLANFVNGFVR